MWITHRKEVGTISEAAVKVIEKGGVEKAVEDKAVEDTKVLNESVEIAVSEEGVLNFF